MSSNVSRDESQAYYEVFSLAVGQRDWVTPNLRHEQLKMLVADVLDGRSGLRIADVGCGAGVMTDFLTRYGRTYGVDFSAPAIEAARRRAIGATFAVGGLEALPAGEYDLITMFDVMEHIAPTERASLIAEIRERLTDDGILFCSTPFPSATRGKRDAGDTALQIIDEEIELPTLVHEAAQVGLQLLRFQAYDVFRGSPEYQIMVFAPRRCWGGGPALRPLRLARRKKIWNSKRAIRAYRLMRAARSVRHGDVSTAIWFLRGRHPPIRS